MSFNTAQEHVRGLFLCLERFSPVFQSRYTLLVGLLSFLGWNQLVEAFFFHSLSCFRVVFDADSVGE